MFYFFLCTYIVCGGIDLLTFLEGRGSHNYEVHMTNLVLSLVLFNVTINCADIWLRAHHCFCSHSSKEKKLI